MKACRSLSLCLFFFPLGLLLPLYLPLSLTLALSLTHNGCPCCGNGVGFCTVATLRLDTCISGFTMSTTSLVKSFSSSLRVEWWNENRSAQACSSLVANLFGTCLVGKRSTSSSSLSEDKIPLVKRFLACPRHKVHKLAQQNVTGHCITLLVYIVVWFLVSLCPVWLRVFKAHSLVLNNTNIWSDCIKL